MIQLASVPNGGIGLLYWLQLSLWVMRVCSGRVSEQSPVVHLAQEALLPSAQVAGIGDALATYFEVNAAL